MNNGIKSTRLSRPLIIRRKTPPLNHCRTSISKMVNSEKHRRQAGYTVIVTMMLFVVISNVACLSRQSNNSMQQDDPYKLSLIPFFFATRFNRKSSKHVSMPPSIYAEKYLLQGMQCHAIYSNKKSTVKEQKLLTHPMQIQNNNVQNTIITSPTIQNRKHQFIAKPPMPIASPRIQNSTNEEKSIQNFATKKQLKTNLIMENNQYAITRGRTVTFICDRLYCYEIDKNTGKKTHYICNEFYCYAMI